MTPRRALVSFVALTLGIALPVFAAETPPTVYTPIGQPAPAAPPPATASQGAPAKAPDPAPSTSAAPTVPAAPAPGSPTQAPGQAPPAPAYTPPVYGYPPAPYYPPPGYAYPPAYAYPPMYGYPPIPVGPPPGHHLHDGFFMRLAMGGGFTSASLSASGTSTTLSGSSFVFDFAFGGALTPEWILFGELVGRSFTQNQRIDGSYAYDYSINAFGMGGGAAYYIMPANIYFSGSILLHQLMYDRSTNSSGSMELSGNGVGLHLMAGKEWWVSSDWGLGLAVDLLLGTAKNRGMENSNYAVIDGRWTTYGLGLLLSSTYN